MNTFSITFYCNALFNALFNFHSILTLYFEGFYVGAYTETDRDTFIGCCSQWLDKKAQ